MAHVCSCLAWRARGFSCWSQCPSLTTLPGASLPRPVSCAVCLVCGRKWPSQRKPMRRRRLSDVSSLAYHCQYHQRPICASFCGVIQSWRRATFPAYKCTVSPGSPCHARSALRGYDNAPATGSSGTEVGPIACGGRLLNPNCELGQLVDGSNAHVS